MSEIKTIVVLTSGGDAPGMNACIRAVVRTAISKGLKVKGILRGYAGLLKEEIIDMDGHSVSDIRIEQTYKGNMHLLATIDGQQRKFVIGKNKEEFATIESTGIANLTDEQLKSMAVKYFKL